MKYVTVGQRAGALRVVKGIAPDDRVIVNGIMRARPGLKVTPEEQKAPARGPAEAQAK
jgi:hypothetical protein